jgi:hypothetical protein
MLNYKEIDNFFGSPLNYIPRPHRPYQFKMGHLVGVAIVGYVIYKGVIKINEDVFGSKKSLFAPISLKEKNKEK